MQLLWNSSQIVTTVKSRNIFNSGIDKAFFAYPFFAHLLQVFSRLRQLRNTLALIAVLSLCQSWTRVQFFGPDPTR